jgi:Fic-DOC domain mobile mystery protein B
VTLHALLGDAQFWARQKSYAPSEAAVRLHHRLVKIHPFPNGNGRHARIMADTVLQRIYGAEPIDWAGGHDLQKMNDRRAAYIAALKAADHEDYAPLIAFIGVRDDL